MGELARFFEYLDSISDFSNNYKELFIKDLIEDYADDLINSKIFNNKILLAIMLFGVWQNLNRKILTFKWEDKLFLINPQRHSEYKKYFDEWKKEEDKERKIEDEEFKNLEVGEKFNIGNKNLKLIEAIKCSCEGCIFQNNISACETFQKKGLIPECSFDEREDGKNIIFKEVENEKSK